MIQGGQQAPFQQPLWNSNASFPTPSTAYVPPAVADPLTTYASQVNTASFLNLDTIIPVSVIDLYLLSVPPNYRDIIT